MRLARVSAVSVAVDLRVLIMSNVAFLCMAASFLLQFLTFFLIFPTCSTHLHLVPLYNASYMHLPYVFLMLLCNILLPHFIHVLTSYFPHIYHMLSSIYMSILWPCTLVYSFLSYLFLSELVLKLLSKSPR